MHISVYDRYLLIRNLFIIRSFSFYYLINKPNLVFTFFILFNYKANINSIELKKRELKRIKYKCYDCSS